MTPQAPRLGCPIACLAQTSPPGASRLHGAGPTGWSPVSPGLMNVASATPGESGDERHGRPRNRRIGSLGAGPSGRNHPWRCHDGRSGTRLDSRPATACAAARRAVAPHRLGASGAPSYREPEKTLHALSQHSYTPPTSGRARRRRRRLGDGIHRGAMFRRPVERAAASLISPPHRCLRRWGYPGVRVRPQLWTIMWTT